MSAMDVIRARHSVRDYESRPLDSKDRDALSRAAEAVGAACGVPIRLVEGNPEPFQLVARFGLIRGAQAYLALFASGTERDETIGYAGQAVVLAAQKAGLNTCWAGMFLRRKMREVPPAGSRARILIAVGHGKTQGRSRKTKSIAELSRVEGERPAPAWFSCAMEAAQLAPTAMNEQNFLVTLRADGRTVSIEPTKRGGWNRIDAGIARRNFEEAAREAGADFRFERALDAGFGTATGGKREKKGSDIA